MGIQFRKLMAVILALTFYTCLLGCGGGKSDNEKWNMPSPNQTGIEPSIGNYSFSQKGSFKVFESDGKKYVKFASDSYRYDNIEVINGAFYREWGLGGEGGYPTDAYAISGSFTTESKAEGLIKYGRDDKITGEGNFIAELRIP